MAAGGFHVQDVLYRGTLVTVLRARRVIDGAPVVLKRLERPRPGTADVLHFRREAEIARRLAGPGIVTVEGIEDSPEGLILTMADSGGSSLDRLLGADQLGGGRLDVLETLRIGSAVAAALGRVHAAGVIHKDVTPANIVWNRTTGTVELIDFGIAAELARESATSTDVRTLEGTVAYMAPEQTGRMNRSVDRRADFYGLGATLYRLLTGRPPFGDADPLGVVHGHIARTPPTPQALEYGVPPAVSAIVMKLLAKDPEARYQSATGLIADLETCLAALLAGEQPKLILGRHDRSERFAIPETLYGRDAEVAALLASFDRVVEGRAELLLIAGTAGIGKSALVHEVQKPMTALRGFFVEGKYDQFKRNVPYSAVIQAFDALARQLLAGSEAELAECAEALRRALGANGAVVTELIPAFALLLGEQPPVPELAPSEAEFRFQLTFQNLAAALTGPERPLVIFLDDLQWADRPSLTLLGRLIVDPDMKHLLVIGACRDDDGNAAAAIALADRLEAEGNHVERLRVGPLTATDVRRMVAETTRRDDPAVDELATLCRAKTQGNPFFLGQFLLAMHDEGLIAFDHVRGCWAWDAIRIAQRDSTDNVVDLMVEKIRRLASATRTALSIAACVGGRFELGDLAAAGDASASELAAALLPAMQEGLVLPLDGAYRTVDPAAAAGEGPRVRYRFLHDRVQQAAYSLIPEGERAAMHVRTGRRLLSGTPDAERAEDLFDILDHLNRAHGLIAEADERLRIAALNLAATRRALASGAAEPALGYGRAGLTLLGDDPWRRNHALALALHDETADAAGMCGDRELMERLCAAVLTHATAPRETIRAHLIRVTALVARGEVAEATEAGLTALRSLGVTLPERGGRIAAVATLLRGRLLLAHPPAPRPSAYGGADLRALARLVFVVFGSVLFARKDMAVPLAYRAVELALRSGDPSMREVALSAWVTLCSFAGAWRDAVKHSPCVDEVLAAEGFGVTSRVVFGFLAFGWHWAEPVTALRPRFRAAYEQALLVGDRDGAGYHLLLWMRCGWLVGQRLPDFAVDLAEAERLLQRIGNTLQAKAIAIFKQAAANLQEGGEPPSRLTGAFMDEAATLAEMEATRNILMLATIYLMKLNLAVVFDTPDAARIAAALGRHLEQMRATSNYPLALLLMALADPAHLAHARRRFRTLAGLGPRNHRHRLLLLDAEHFRRRGRAAAAERAYDAAIAAARENGYVSEEALANERAAAFYQERGRDTPALAYRAQARDCYERWGATAKVRDLERGHPALQRVWPGAGPLSTTYSTTSTMRDASGLDVAAILRAAEAISGEIRRDVLLGTLMRTVLETAGAVRGVLLMAGADGALQTAAEGDTERAQYRALPAQPLAVAADAPAAATLAAYVTRTREPLVLADAAEDPRFAADPYVAARLPRSVLCLPLLRQGALIGVLYLENNLTRAAFVAERLQALRLLAAQIAAALENARLYDELNVLTRELEFQVAERTRELRTQSQRLQATLASMSDALAVFDADHRLRVWNRRAEAIFPTLAFREGLRYEDMLAALVAGGTVRADLRFEFHGGPEEIDLSDGRIVQVRRNVMPDGGMVRVYLDVTDDRRRERELRAANEQLVTAQTQLVQSEKLASLGQLVAGVAHEINSPLGVALTGASFLAGETERIRAAVAGGTLRRSEFQQFVTDTEEIASLLTSNIARAAELVQSFKQVAVDQTSDDRRRFVLRPRLEEIVFSLSPTWKKAGHRIELDCPDGLEVDGFPGVLAQIVTNLVVNSVTHAYPPGRTGVMRLSVTRPQLGWIELVYADDGQGIPEEHRAKVFDPFFTTRRGAGSTGLGLHIVFNLVTAKLGGVIRLNGGETGGTRFVLRFPVSAPAEPTPA